MSVGDDWHGWFYTPVCGYKFHGLTVYLHTTFIAPPIGGALRQLAISHKSSIVNLLQDVWHNSKYDPIQ